MEDLFIITVNDNGRRFEPDQIPTPPTTDNIENIKIGGLGIHFMRQLMDDVSFSFDPQTGNELIMKKKIKAETS